jgi:hypothetical protein
MLAVSTNDTKKGLQRLKFGFLLVLIGGILGLLPVISTLGEIIGFIGFFLLILGWWAFGKSNLKSEERYHNTALVLIATFVIVFLGIVIGVLAIIFGAISSQVPGSTTSTASFAVLIATQVVELTVVMECIALVGQLYSAFSLRKLSLELSEPYFRKSSNYYIMADIVTIGSLGGLVASVQVGAFQNLIQSAITNNSSSQITVYSFLFTGDYAFLGILTLIGNAMIFIAVYFFYRGAQNGIRRLGEMAVTTPVPSSLQRRTTSDLSYGRECPWCRKKLYPSENGELPSTCYYCGKELPKVFWE